MRIDIKRLKRDAETKSNMFTLVNLTLLSDFKKQTRFTRMLQGEYKEVRNDSWEVKIMLTLVNSILTQNRAVFILTRDSIAKLIEKDNNHINKVSLNNRDYKHFINYITNSLINITKYKRFNRDVMVATVKDINILSLIKADRYSQLNEVIMFVTGEVDETEKKILDIIHRYQSFKVTPIEQNTSFKNTRKIQNIIEKYDKMKKLSN